MPTNRFRISDKIIATGPRKVPDSELYKQGKDCFDIFFSSNQDVSKSLSLRDYYVENEIDAEISDFISQKVDSILVVKGLRGSGKSASVQYHFGTSSGTSFRDKTAYIRLYFDHKAETGLDELNIFLQEQIGDACDKLMEEFEFETSEFINFVKSTKGALISEFSISEKMFDHKENEILQKLKSISPLAHSVSLLKFCATKLDLGNIFIIADDMESIKDGDALRSILKQILSTKKCLENLGQLGTKNYTVKLLLSMRPATYDALENSDLHNGYDFGSPVYLKPVDITKIFKRKFDHHMLNLEDTMSRETWSLCMTILVNLINDVNARHQNLFIGLSNYNIRVAFRFLRNLLKNSIWLEKLENTEDPSSRNLNDRDYHVTNASVIRGLCLKEKTVYRSLGDHPITNIFYNNIGITSDFIPILTYLYLKNHRNDTGYSKINLLDFCDSINEIFETDFSNSVKDYFNYMSEQNSFRESRLNNGTFITQPKYWYLIKYIESSSLYIECFYDDTYIKHPSIEAGWIPNNKAAADLGDNVFFAAADFVSHIYNCEKLLYDFVVKNNKPGAILGLVRNCELLSEKCLIGLEYSVDGFFRTEGSPPKLAPLLKDLKRRVGELKEGNLAYILENPFG